MQRKASPINHKRTTRRRRAFALLLLWLFAWTAWALQPCCEALAAAIPHHFESEAAPAHAGHDHGAAHDHTPVGDRHHNHCPNAKSVDLGIPAPLAGAVSGHGLQSPLDVPVGCVALSPSVVQQPTLVRLRHRPPRPVSIRPFLVQRLLI